MPKGSNKMKVAGFTACISAGLAAGLFIYALIQLSNTSSSFIFSKTGLDSSSVYGVMAFIIILNIYKVIAGGYAVSKAEKTQKAGVAMANAIIALIFSAIWMMLMIYSASRSVSLNALGVVLLVLSIADVVMFIIVIVGAVQNGNKVMVNSWGPSPYGGYNQMPGGMPMPGQYPQQPQYPQYPQYPQPQFQQPYPQQPQQYPQYPQYPQQPYGYQNGPFTNPQQYAPQAGFQQPYPAPRQGEFTSPAAVPQQQPQQQPVQQQNEPPKSE